MLNFKDDRVQFSYTLFIAKLSDILRTEYGHADIRTVDAIVEAITDWAHVTQHIVNLGNKNYENNGPRVRDGSLR